MSPEVMAHVSEPFFITKRAGKGTGLGLSAVYGIIKPVYGIIKQSGGSIWIEGDVRSGSTFYMVFPVAEAAAKAAPAELPGQSSRERRPSCSSKTRPDSGNISGKLWSGTPIGWSRPPAAARPSNWRRETSAMSICLLTDMVMPEMGGAELAAFSSHGPRVIPVLCMSGYSDRAWLPDRRLYPKAFHH